MAAERNISGVLLHSLGRQGYCTLKPLLYECLCFEILQCGCGRPVFGVSLDLVTRELPTGRRKEKTLHHCMT